MCIYYKLLLFNDKITTIKHNKHFQSLITYTSDNMFVPFFYHHPHYHLSRVVSSSSSSSLSSTSSSKSSDGLYHYCVSKMYFMRRKNTFQKKNIYLNFLCHSALSTLESNTVGFLKSVFSAITNKHRIRIYETIFAKGEGLKNPKTKSFNNDNLLACSVLYCQSGVCFL